jgi:hypothetical protein
MPRFGMPARQAVVGAVVIVALVGLAGLLRSADPLAEGALPTPHDGSTPTAAGAQASSATAGPICAGRFELPSGTSDRAVVPICTNGDLAVGDPNATRLVVVVHGDGRNAPGYFDDVVRAAATSAVTDAVIVAPQFATRSDLRGQGIDGVSSWSSESWKSGDRSRSDGDLRRVSSFDVVDALITDIVDGGRFPAIRTVIVAGHSAGGQFVNRYAAASPVDQAIRKAGVALRFVVANPSSYLYFDDRRVDDQGRLAVPSDADRQDCRHYDDYKYGLGARNEYLAQSSTDQIAARYASRVVTYVAGDLDTDPEDPTMDRSCEARLQGVNRLARARNYVASLTTIFGPGVLERHRLIEVPGIGHDGGAILNDPLVRPWLLGSGDG